MNYISALCNYILENWGLGDHILLWQHPYVSAALLNQDFLEDLPLQLHIKLTDFWKVFKPNWKHYHINLSLPRYSHDSWDVYDLLMTNDWCMCFLKCIQVFFLKHWVKFIIYFCNFFLKEFTHKLNLQEGQDLIKTCWYIYVIPELSSRKSRTGFSQFWKMWEMAGAVSPNVKAEK